MRAVRLLCLMSGFLLSGNAVPAQGPVSLPEEAELNRMGLTLGWWGQAVMDPHRETALFLRVDEQAVFVQSTSGIITSFNGETGRRMWSQLIGAPNRQSFPVSTNDDQVLVSLGMSVYSLNKATGSLMWEVRVPIHPSAPPEVSDEQLFVGTSDGSIYSYDLRKIDNMAREGMLPQWIQRALMWRFKTPREIVSTPVTLGTTVAFASRAGIVYGVSDANKQLKFQFESEGRIDAPIGKSGDVLFVADTKSRLFCISTVNGRVRWMYTSGAPVMYQPKAIGRHVFVVPQREGLQCLSTASGVRVWQKPEATEFIAASENRVYASDAEGRLLIIERDSGTVISRLDLRPYSLRVQNDRTDRIVLATTTGTVISLRETSSDYPVYHLYPERRPILPMLAPEEDAVPAEPQTTSVRF